MYVFNLYVYVVLSTNNTAYLHKIDYALNFVYIDYA